MQYPLTFLPDQIEVVDVGFVVVVEADLLLGTIVFQLPVRRGSDDQMNAAVFHFAHLAAVAGDYFVVGFYHRLWLQGKGRENQIALHSA